MQRGLGYYTVYMRCCQKSVRAGWLPLRTYSGMHVSGLTVSPSASRGSHAYRCVDWTVLRMEPQDVQQGAIHAVQVTNKLQVGMVAGVDEGTQNPEIKLQQEIGLTAEQFMALPRVPVHVHTCVGEARKHPLREGRVAVSHLLQLFHYLRRSNYDQKGRRIPSGDTRSARTRTR